jgi:hypothetical protein
MPSLIHESVLHIWTPSLIHESVLHICEIKVHNG